MTSPVPAPDHALRRQALDTSRSFIVQAPAGSGKTELLIQRFLALLASVDQPEAILAITFTRKAAGEMRDRVLSALDAASRGEQATDTSRALTLQLALLACQRDSQLNWRLRDNPNRLRIQTIDSLNAQIASRMPWLSRFGSQPDVVDDATELYDEAARRTVELLGESDALAAAMSAIALHLDNDLRRIRVMLAALLARRDQWLRHLGAGTPPENLRAVFEQSIQLTNKSALDAVIQAIPRELLAPLRHSYNFAAASLGHPSWDSPALSRDVAQRLANLLLTKNNEWRATVNTSSGFPPSARAEKAAFTSLLAHLSRQPALRDALTIARRLPPPNLPDQQWETLHALFLLLPAAAAQLKIVFRERRQVDFIEIAEAAARGLGDPQAPTDLGLYLGERYEHILVDEAQDTSVSQIDLLRRLTAGWVPSGARTLFLVGDPMQSIYRFREADVSLFLRLRRHGLDAIPLESLVLSANFRSRPEIVDWTNQVFPTIFPAAEDLAAGAVPYSPSQPARTPARSAQVAVHPLFDPSMEVEAALVAGLVEQSKSGRTAILVRARTHAPAIVDELKRRGIRFRAVDLDPLSSRPVVGDLIALTRALLHVADRTAWLAVLRAPWCGLTLTELLDLAHSAGRGTLLDALAGSPHPRIRPVYLTLLRGLRSARRVPLRRLVEQTWIDLGGPSCLDSEAAAEEARCFFNLLDRLDDAGDLADLTMLEDHAANLYAPPDPAAPADLEIMTIHKAKGLEFDTVILPGLGRGSGIDRRPLLQWAEVDTPLGPRLLMAPIEATGEEDDPLYLYLRFLESRKARFETARLLYVAATRAREQLHLVGHVRHDDNGIRKPHPGSLLELLWPAVAPQFAEAFDNRPLLSQLPLPLTGLTQTIRRLNDLPTSSPPPPPPTFTHHPPDDEPSIERTVGVAAHGLLDRIATQGPDWWHALSPPARHSILDSVLASLGVPASELPAAATRLAHLLDRVCSSPRGRWILTPRPSAANELAICHNGERHVIDRTFIENGVRWIIDYKTGAPGQARVQLERYARAMHALHPMPLRLGIYLPASDSWEEWTPASAALS
jgi:ATP-dependent exoDNAse (exonuclease V) beta subunit